jgi:hypothetical protein
MKTRILLYFNIVILLSSCENNSELSERVKKLNNENKVLRSLIDSITEAMDNENIEILVFDSSRKNRDSDSTEFLVAITYNRADLIRSIHGQITSDEDSAEYIMTHDSEKEIKLIFDRDSPKTIYPLTFSNMKNGLNYFAGYVKINTRGNKKISIQI